MKLHEKHMEGSPVDIQSSSPHGGARPKTKQALPTPLLNKKENQVEEGTVSASEDDLTEAQCIENSEVTISPEVMNKIQYESVVKIRKKYKVEVDFKTFSIKGQLENLQNFEGYLRNLNENDTKEDALSASDDEEEFPSIMSKAVDKISHVRYQIFKYFFYDLYVSFLHDVELCFSRDEGCIYVKGKKEEDVNKTTQDIRNSFSEMDNFQESDLNIKEEKLELAKELVMEMNSNSPERKVYCYLYDPLAIHIVARTWNEVEAAKHKINLRLGYVKTTGRKKKLSAFNDSKDNKQSPSVSSESSPPDNTRKSFTTAEGIKIFVYKCSILRAPVDVIVSAANEDLNHIGGVAKIIADEAGREFTEESKRYIKENGNLTVGVSCVTSGGNLKYSFVIHTVGPQWDKYSKTSEGVQQCMNDLWKAVMSCFFKAETLQVQSIALPAISSDGNSSKMEVQNGVTSPSNESSIQQRVECGKLKVGDVLEIDAGDLKCQKVICCIVPKWTSSMSDEDYKRQLGQCFRNILEKARAYKSVAVPLIGKGYKENSIKICGRVLLDCLLKFSKALGKKEAIQEVHIVSLDNGPTTCVKSIFTEYFDTEKRLDAERRNPGYMGRGSATVYAGQGQQPQNSNPQNKKGRQVGKPSEDNMASTENVGSYNPGSEQPPEAQKINRGGDDIQDTCAICLNTFDNPVKMKKCGHLFCKGCIDTHMQYKPVCPVCGTIYGIITGNQPEGKMTAKVDNYCRLEGYNECGSIVITYEMLNGVQGDEHPKPGQQYYGLRRNAYLPNNEKGQKVFRLLQLAFDRRLIFTIGRSVTSGKEDMVTWNDIHHKTNKYGGPQKYGYPDPTYLDRVLDELAAKGVTEESEHLQGLGTSIAYEEIVLESTV